MPALGWWDNPLNETRKLNQCFISDQDLDWVAGAGLSGAKEAPGFLVGALLDNALVPRQRLVLG